MNGIDLNDVDPFHPSLIKSESVALALGKDKVERYIAKGRPLEAQGARSVVRIMWQAFMEHSDIDTGWGEL
jgi:succinyl-CoA synthetase beta subunit